MGLKTFKKTVSSGQPQYLNSALISQTSPYSTRLSDCLCLTFQELFLIKELFRVLCFWLTYTLPSLRALTVEWEQEHCSLCVGNIDSEAEACLYVPRLRKMKLLTLHTVDVTKVILTKRLLFAIS